MGMRIVTTVTCDACGKIDSAEGIWSKASLGRDGWIEIRANTKTQEDLFVCSIPCAHKILDTQVKPKR